MGQRFDQRQGFLVSAAIHLVLLTLFVKPEQRTPLKRRVSPPEPAEVVEVVHLPPPEVLRQLLPPPPGPAREARPSPPPPGRDARQKDRISVGPPSDRRAEGPLVLRREDDLTATPKGVPSPGAPAARQGQETGREVESPVGAERPQFRADGAAPAGRATDPAADPTDAAARLPRGGEEGARQRGVADGAPIGSSLRNLERRLGTLGPQGLESGTGQQMGPLFFDPLGADFTVWTNHFKNDVYRNWIMPQPFMMGFRGHVDLEFTVGRDGRIQSVRLLKSSGTPAFDRAARNALLGSRLLPLPADYGPPRVTMQVGFYYNEGPGRS